MAGDQTNANGPAAADSHLDLGDNKAERGSRAPGDDTQTGEKTDTPRPTWANVWQIPTIILSAILIVWGIRSAMGPTEALDFDATLAAIEQHIADGEHERAALQLRTAIEPHLDSLQPAQRAVFHRAVADYHFYAQPPAHGSVSVSRHIAEHYARAADLGAALDPKRLERWAEVMMASGDMAGARARLAELDASLASLEGDPEVQQERLQAVRASRNRVFRRLVEYQLRAAVLPFDELMEVLAAYRVDPQLSTEDELWAVARMAELRLIAGHTQQAIDLLLVDMRRLEGRNLHSENAGLGELYALLGRGYFELGDYDKSAAHLETALQLLPGSHAVRGDAMLYLGRIAFARGEFDVALERFHNIVSDYVMTRSYLPGLLGRAETYGVTGEHESSQADYRQLVEQLQRVGLRRDITPEHVAASLCDRHDAALALGRLDRALAYVTIAEELFPPEKTPGEVLFRLASTNRQMADDLIRQASGGEIRNATYGGMAQIDPAIRYEASLRYEKAGQYYLRHANAEQPDRYADNSWATSLWMAADSFDCGGRQDLAIQHFLRYRDNRAVDDPRRAEVLFRLAQAHHAQGDCDQAINFYERILEDHGRTGFAARSYVPLARCLLAVNRPEDAKQQLHFVLGGGGLLEPDARDYRDALIELGRIHHEQGEFVHAIERLTEATQRYPDDPRRLEVLYLLADSYRANAMIIADRIKNDYGISAGEIGQLTSLRAAHLQSAKDAFTMVVEADESGTVSDLSLFEQDMLRRARLYQADCAFHLGQYSVAIQYYEQVARRYSSHQSSMYALVQIVNCYNELGDVDRAAAAHRRALVRLQQLPDAVFAAPDALMDRAAWERWLDNNPVASTRTASANAAPG